MKTSVLLLSLGLFALPLHAQLTLGDAVDAISLPWTTGGNSAWAVDTATTHDGADAARCGAVLDRQESWLETTVVGPGTLSFWWKVSSELDFDWLRLHVNGILQHQISGEVNWQQYSIALPQGTHTLRWRYVKDVSDTFGQDRGWVDQVSFTPGSGAPTIAVEPLNQTVWEGANITLSAVALGSAPLAHQWLLNNGEIATATNASLDLSNITVAAAGSYRVVVTNIFGAVTSAPAIVTLTNNGPATQVLLFVDSPLGSPFELALLNLGLAYQRFTFVSSFNTAINNANRATTLVIVDAPQNNYDLSSIISFINGGGRVLLGANSLAGSPALATALKVAIESRSSVPLPIYNWGGTPLFTGLAGVLGRTEIGLPEDNQALHALPGAVPVAGFVSSITPGEAAVVIADGGRTIVNGFWIAGVSPSASAVQFAENEILFLTSAVSATAPLIKIQPRSQTNSVGGTVSFEVLSWGAQPLNYQWLKDGLPLSGAVSSTYQIASVRTNDSGGFSVIVSNAHGSVTSSPAALTVTTIPPGPMILLLVDGTAPGPVPTALTGRGYSYQQFTDASTFNAALASASAANTLAVVDDPRGYSSYSTLVNFVSSGGRAILQYWDLSSVPSLAAAFNATVTYNMYLPDPVYNWGGSSLFAGLPSPLSMVNQFNPVGEKLQPSGTGQAVAGWISTPTATDGALVIGNQGRTILNGLPLKEISPTANGVRLAQNEVEFLIGLPAAPPSITQQPQSRTNSLGSTATFSVSASGTAPLTYQWFLNGTNLLPGASNATLTLPSVQLADAGGYHVVVSNAYGTATSAVATLTVVVIPPSITQQPQSRTNSAGSTATFSVSASGTAPLNYQWFFDDISAVAGTTNATLAIPNVQLSDAGHYHVVVSNAYGVLASAPAYLSVVPLIITTQPQSLTVSPGSNVIFRVIVESSVPVTYQWHLNGSPLPDATVDTLSIPNVQPAQRGTYTVVVSNSFGSVASDPATLTVLVRPTIVQQPRSPTVAVGDTVSMSVAVTNEATLPITYRWRRNGPYVLTNIVSQTTGLLLITNVQTNHAGTYAVVITNLAGNVPTSSNAFLTVVVPPTNQTAMAGTPVTFAARAVGPAPIRYQWQFNGLNLPDATNAFLTLANVQLADAGAYAVVVTAATNVPIAPATFPATLTVVSADSDGDGMPDDWEIAHGLNKDSAADAGLDADGDTMTNFEEFIAGTDPNDAQSNLRIASIERGTGQVTLQFLAISNKTYTLEASDLVQRDLVHTGAWVRVMDVSAVGSNRVIQTTDAVPADGGQRFYRLVVPARP